MSKDEHSRFIFFAGIAAHGSEIGRCAPRALWAYSLCGQTSAESAGGLRSGPMKGAERTGFRGVALGETAICVAIPGVCLKILKRQFRRLLRRYGAAHFLRKPASLCNCGFFLFPMHSGEKTGFPAHTGIKLLHPPQAERFRRFPPRRQWPGRSSLRPRCRYPGQSHAAGRGNDETPWECPAR